MSASGWATIAASGGSGCPVCAQPAASSRNAAADPHPSVGVFAAA